MAHDQPKTPSTGNASRSQDEPDSIPADHPAGASQTRTSVKGDHSPRLPHERDESSDSTGAEPNETMKQAHADVMSGKVATDRSVEADATYEKLREPVPGNERDDPKNP